MDGRGCWFGRDCGSGCASGCFTVCGSGAGSFVRNDPVRRRRPRLIRTSLFRPFSPAKQRWLANVEFLTNPDYPQLLVGNQAAHLPNGQSQITCCAFEVEQQAPVGRFACCRLWLLHHVGIVPKNSVIVNIVVVCYDIYL
jgi:hypothetical protein